MRPAMLGDTPPCAGSDECQQRRQRILAISKNEQIQNHAQLEAFSACFASDRDDLGRLIFDARIIIKSSLGIVSEPGRVMLTHVLGDTGEVVIFKSRELDIKLYYLDFTAAYQTFAFVSGRFLRIEGQGTRTGNYICEIHPFGFGSKSCNSSRIEGVPITTTPP